MTTDTEKTRPFATIPTHLMAAVTTYAGLRAQGMTITDASKAVGRERTTGQRWERSAWWPAAIDAAQSKLLQPLNVQQALAPHVPRALQRMLDVLETDSPEQVRMAAQWILERYYGKALTQTQATTHTTHTIDVGNAVRVLREAQQRALPGPSLDVDFTVVDDEAVNHSSITDEEEGDYKESNGD